MTTGVTTERLCLSGDGPQQQGMYNTCMHGDAYKLLRLRQLPVYWHMLFKEQGKSIAAAGPEHDTVVQCHEACDHHQHRQTLQIAVQAVSTGWWGVQQHPICWRIAYMLLQ